MDFFTLVMNLVATPTLLTTLFLLLPPFVFFKLFISTFSFLFPEDLTHKAVIITGASSGIGEHLAYEYAKKGANLVLVAKRERSLREVADQAQGLGAPDVLIVPADVSNYDDCQRFIEAAVNRFGRLDHLVNNAGISHACMFEEVSNVKNFTTLMDVNFWGSVYATYLAVPHLKKTRGKIIVNASAGGWLPYPRMSFYNASKSAMINFFETLRVEFGSEIGITIVTAGWTESEMTKGKFLAGDGKLVVDQEMRDVQMGLNPVICSEECAKAIVDAARRGKHYLTVPTWIGVMYLWRVFVPEVIDLLFRLFLIARPGTATPPSKIVMDAIGAKEILYPASIREPEIKVD
ncbi:putative 11-beta-hydroxysteroid dehydrogenase [Dioscorea sansibarensis]